jgi:hypothetical protein
MGRLRLLLLSIGFLAGCAGQAPRWVRIESTLLPDAGAASPGPVGVEVADNGYRVTLQGCVVSVVPVGDAELNRRFAEVSFRRENSANPYTYGNWVDPELGYTPPRFTVFRVSARQGSDCLQRLQDLLLATDQGDTLRVYRYPDSSSTGLLAKLREDWAKQPSLLLEAEGILRRTYLAWGPEAESPLGEGYVAFDPLDYAVDRLTLILIWRGDSRPVRVPLAFRQHLARVDEPSH